MIQSFPLCSILYLSSFELTESSLDFEKCLVGEKKELQFYIKNNSCSDTVWTIMLGMWSHIGVT